MSANLGRGRIGIVVAALVAGGLVLSPAKASSPTHRVAAAPPLPGGISYNSVRGGESQVRTSHPSIEQLLRTTDFSGGVTTSLDLARQLIVEEGGPQLPDLDPSTSLSRTGRSTPASATGIGRIGTGSFEGIYTWTFPVRDLDGDGGDDLIAQTSTADGLDTEALSGIDGSRLWRSDPSGPVADAFLAPAGDVDGDGVDDLVGLALVVDSTSTGDCNSGSSCSYRHRWDFSWKGSLVSGATGVTRWSRPSTGWLESSHIRKQSGGLVRRSFTTSDRFEGENFFYVLDGGRPGQTRPGVVSNVIGGVSEVSTENTTTARVLTKDAGSSSLRGTTDASVLDGVTGDVVHTVHDEGDHISILRWGGQLVGDPSTDLLWIGSGESDTSHTCRTVDALVIEPTRCPDAREEAASYQVVSAVDGATWAPAWESRTPSVWYQWSWLGDDLSGDGVPDVRMVDYSTPSTTLLSGANGAVMWTSPGFVIEQTAEMGGAPGPDALLVRFNEPWADDELRVTSTRVEGATGEVFATTSHALDVTNSNWIQLQVAPTGQAGGTSSPDVFFGLGAVDIDFETNTVIQKHTDLYVEDGASAQLVTERHDDEMSMLAPLADVNGDGLTDAALAHYEIVTNEDEWGQYLGIQRVDDSMLSLTDMTALWPLPTDRYLDYSTDLDGDGVSELIFARSLDDGAGTELSAVNGTDGSTRWTWTHSV